MAYEETLVTQSYEAASDLSNSQYRFVKVSADDKVDLPSGSTDDIIGIVQGTTESGKSAEVAISGTSKIHASDTLSAGDLVVADSNGDAVKIASDATGAELDTMTRLLGTVVNGAGSNEYASVLIDKQIVG